MNRPEAESVASYEAACSCGRPLRGQRQPTAQIIACPACGRKRFILPQSPWLAPAAAAKTGQAAYAYLIRLLIVIVLGGAAAMALIFFLARPYLRRPAATDAATEPVHPYALLVDGESQLRDGNVFRALKQLSLALDRHRLHPEALSRQEFHRLDQLWRQTDLLAHLLDQPLEEIVLKAKQHRSDKEWDEKFQNYRGRTIVFDDVLRLEAPDRPVLASYVVSAGDIEARVALEDLTLLRQLPLDPPRRWLFGARLASCRLEQGGVWVFRFDPDSAVLLSDRIAAALCCPPPLDEKLLEVLERQSEWLRR
jgi:hypothetical protein